jgi:predicted RNase H-like HicB family nuclease
MEVVLEKQKKRVYTIYVPSLSVCVSQGETKEEALKNIKEAIELFLM